METTMADRISLVDDLGFVENTFNMFEYVVPRPRRIFCDMLRPQHGRLLAIVQER